MHGNIIFHCAVSVIYRNNRYKNMTDKNCDISFLASINTTLSNVGITKNFLRSTKFGGFSRIIDQSLNIKIAYICALHNK